MVIVLGPVGPLISNVDGVDAIVGVHHRSNCSTYGQSERVDIHALEFIQPALVANGAEPSCEEDGLCGGDCDMPDPDCVCAADDICSDACPYKQLDMDCPEFFDAGTDEGGCQAGGSGGFLSVLFLLTFVFRRRKMLNIF